MTQPPVPELPAGSPKFSWSRLVKTPRGAVGLVIWAAALLLWPFSEWSLIPWLAGIGALVLLRLLRLDGLLKGWVLHLGGLVVVIGLMWTTGPWAWALAASIGALLAGLVQLPAWRLAAVGGALCVVSGMAFGFAGFQERQLQAQRQAETSERNYALTGERSETRVLPALLEGIDQADVVGVCGLLDERARAAFVQASAAADCAAAVVAFREGVAGDLEYEDLSTETVATADGWITDACETVWASPSLGGESLGRIRIRETESPGGTFFLAAFLPC